MKRAVLLMVFLAVLCGCKQETPDARGSGASTTDVRESIVGQYGLKSEGKVVPFIRVSHQPSSREWVMSEWGQGEWNGGETSGGPPTAEMVKTLEAAGLSHTAVSLRFGKTILVKVPEADASSLNGSTGVALLTEIGPVELTPLGSPAR